MSEDNVDCSDGYDETPVGVQSERARGKNHQAYLWQYSRPGGAVVFDFRMGRERERERERLGRRNLPAIKSEFGYLVHIRLGQRCFADQFSS
jgi:hypothetical protein